jgi:hypothetical protein
MHQSPQRDIPQIGRRAVIAHDPVWKHGEWMRAVAEEHSRPMHAKTASSIRVIHIDELAAIRVRLFQRRKLAHLGTERFVRQRMGMRDQGDRKTKSETAFRRGRSVSVHVCLQSLDKVRIGQHTLGSKWRSYSPQIVADPKSATRSAQVRAYSSTTLLLSPNFSVSTPIR